MRPAATSAAKLTPKASSRLLRACSWVAGFGFRCGAVPGVPRRPHVHVETSRRPAFLRPKGPIPVKKGQCGIGNLHCLGAKTPHTGCCMVHYPAILKATVLCRLEEPAVAEAKLEIPKSGLRPAIKTHSQHQNKCHSIVPSCWGGAAPAAWHRGFLIPAVRRPAPGFLNGVFF